MMNLFFLEFLVKERQQQIFDEFMRIHIARAASKSEAGIFNKMILRLREVLITMGIRLEKHCRPSDKPALDEHDVYPTELSSNPKPSRPKRYHRNRRIQ